MKTANVVVKVGVELVVGAAGEGEGWVGEKGQYRVDGDQRVVGERDLGEAVAKGLERVVMRQMAGLFGPEFEGVEIEPLSRTVVQGMTNLFRGGSRKVEVYYDTKTDRTWVKGMSRTGAIVERVVRRVMAGGDIMVEPFSRYVVISRLGIPTRRADLKGYTTELALAESEVNAEAMKVIAWAKGLGVRAVKRNTGISPSEGVVGCVVEFNRMVEPEEVKTLGK